MLLFIAAVLVLLWLLGFLGHIGGDFIHLVLLVAVIVLIYHLLARHRSAQ